MKPLSRTPFVLMLQDDSGELVHVKLDPNLVNSDNAIIVLDEYQDACWIWIGRDVAMPTRMHALRMSKSVQKAGYTVEATTIGRSVSNLIEMMEKDDSDPEVASNIATFRDMLGRKWSFESGVLAYDQRKAAEYAAQPLEPIAGAPVTTSAPELTPISKPREIEVVAETVEPEPVRPQPAQPSVMAEKKAAFLLYSAVKNADVVYVEKIERSGSSGLRVEAPGVMVLEALLEGNDISISPENFGDNEQATEIKKTYETWVKRL